MLGLYLFPINLSHADEVSIIPAGEFSKGKLNEWLPKKFINETSYSLIKVGKNTVLRAVSQNSASGLIKKIRVDMEPIPIKSQGIGFIPYKADLNPSITPAIGYNP